jgi:pentatricopeptide repeat protein
LLDAFGSIEPVDVASLESTFQDALSQSYVQGPHWAALINAWGCVLKDLDRAVEIFQSIKAQDQALPDAIVYEAFFSALFTAKRLDLVSQYLDRMRESGVHMTAYIANVLIRGYTSVGNMDRARATFDSLVDPPIGVAAPHNHLTPSAPSVQSVPADAPVYREVSESLVFDVGARLTVLLLE